MSLLRDIAGDGYPTDYLVSRVRARRAALDSRRPVAREPTPSEGTTDEAIWDRMLHEHAWLRSQMQPHLRRDFDGLFLLFELKTLVLCLRCKAVERIADLRRLLADSQLGGSMRRALLEQPDVPSAVAAVAEAWAADTGAPTALTSAFAAGGLQGFEHRIVREHLERLARLRLPPCLQEFVGRFIDLRNLMTLYKHLRWQVGDVADFIAGGRLDVAEFRAASSAKELAALARLAGRILGGRSPPVTLEETALETLLLRQLTRDLRAMARAPAEAGALLEYAWCVYVHARDESLAMHAADVDAARLARERVA